jgi:hypothetical protein
MEYDNLKPEAFSSNSPEEGGILEMCCLSHDVENINKEI